MTGASYLWSGPNSFTSTDANPTLFNFQKSDTGLYQLLVTFGQCIASTNKEINYQICSADIPNVMTPNGDGLNDFFQPANYNLESIECKIYDRWGVLIAEWTNLNGYWDGKNQFTNKEVPEGVYYYIINMQPVNSELKNYKGFIQLFRD
jgi:gliding motility-associated-like protein